MSDTKLASPPEQLTEMIEFFSNLPLKFKTFKVSKNNSRSSTKKCIKAITKKMYEIKSLIIDI